MFVKYWMSIWVRSLYKVKHVDMQCIIQFITHIYRVCHVRIVENVGIGDDILQYTEYNHM